jgi:cytochrome c oxidase cbb3-type subunit III
MSDFTHEFWPWYVGAISLVSILACALLLWIAGKATVHLQPGQTDNNTTGHVWDENLRELNNPLPRWWMWLFILTVIFALAYLVFFPGLGSFKGTLNWSSTETEHKQDASDLRVRVAPLYAAFAVQPIEMLAKDSRALALGERIFMNNCAQCHGSDARGGNSYPNLANGNAAWLGERSAAHIVNTVTNGRTGLMPALGAVIGGDEEIRALAHYVLSLSGSPHNGIKAYSGKKLYASCAACHGVDGKGNKALGAPNLADDYWLYGWGEESIVNAIRNGKNNVMPAQAPKLSAEQIHVVAAYVLSLSSSSSPPSTSLSTAPAVPSKVP